MTTTILTNTRRAAALLAFAGLALVAAANPPESSKAPPLSGPSVKTIDAPGAKPNFGEMNFEGKRGAMRDAVPHQVFMQSVERAVGAGAPENVRLTAQQRAEIEKISNQFTEKLSAFMRDHKDEFMAAGGPDALRKGAAKGKAKGDPQAASKPDAQRSAMLERLRELRAMMPSPADTHKQVWAVLTEPQRAAVQSQLDAFKAKSRAQSDEAYVARRAKKQNAENAQKSGGGQLNEQSATKAAASLKIDDPAVRARIEAAMAKLTPDQREQFLRRLEQGLANRQSGKPASESNSNNNAPDAKKSLRKGTKIGAGDKPAPGMKSVNVPEQPGNSPR